jgi:hypothetical protein
VVKASLEAAPTTSESEPKLLPPVPLVLLVEVIPLKTAVPPPVVGR